MIERVPSLEEPTQDRSRRPDCTDLGTCCFLRYRCAVLTFDHAFVFVEPGHREANFLRKLGLTLEFQRDHIGQGTANDLLLFDENYLELIYLRSRSEAERNELRLDRRADHANTGASPFGVALRGSIEQAQTLPGLGPEAWMKYQLPGTPMTLHLLRETLDNIALPLVFGFDTPPSRTEGPTQDRRLGQHPIAFVGHVCGVSGIDSLELIGPKYGAFAGGDASGLLPACLRWADGERPRMRVALRGGGLVPTQVCAELEVGAGG